MSENLKLFYWDYALWLKNGALPHPSFSRFNGLCSSLLMWCIKHNIDSILLEEMEDQFRKAGLDMDIPFNRPKEGDRSYIDETSSNEAHLNEKRRKWVFDHAE